MLPVDIPELVTLVFINDLLPPEEVSDILHAWFSDDNLTATYSLALGAQRLNQCLANRE